MGQANKACEIARAALKGALNEIDDCSEEIY